jgi:hypothetical protein
MKSKTLTELTLEMKIFISEKVLLGHGVQWEVAVLEV